MQVIIRNLPYLVQGLWTTLALASISICLSAIFGTAVGLGRLSRHRIIRYLSAGYIELIRAVPLIMVIFWIFFLLPIITGNSIPPFRSAVVAFVVFTSAYIGEIVRAGIQSIPYGQTEAALSSGLKPWQAMLFVILPQAFTRMIPPLVGQFISLFKDTSLAYIIGVLEITRRATIVNNREFKSFEIFTFVAIAYFAFCYGLSLCSRRLERRLAVGRH